jgi:hypothetical protein
MVNLVDGHFETLRQRAIDPQAVPKTPQQRPSRNAEISTFGTTAAVGHNSGWSRVKSNRATDRGRMRLRALLQRPVPTTLRAFATVGLPLLCGRWQFCKRGVECRLVQAILKFAGRVVGPDADVGGCENAMPTVSGTKPEVVN